MLGKIEMVEKLSQDRHYCFLKNKEHISMVTWIKREYKLKTKTKKNIKKNKCTVCPE